MHRNNLVIKRFLLLGGGGRIPLLEVPLYLSAHECYCLKFSRIRYASIGMELDVLVT